MSSDRCNICGRGDRLQEVGRFGATYCIDCISVSEKRATAPIVKSVEPTDDPRVVAKAYRSHKLAIGKPVADYDADGILCRALERSADRIEVLEARCRDAEFRAFRFSDALRSILNAYNGSDCEASVMALAARAALEGTNNE